MPAADIAETLQRALPGVAEPVPTVHCGAGTVTRRVMDAAEAAGFVFAVDPTSADASCIGGNVAMNAGGKKAVLWGTALDNLASWRMVDPTGHFLEVTRLDHNLGKIHDVAVARFSVQRYRADGVTLFGNPEILEIPGATFRKTGLGKGARKVASGSATATGGNASVRLRFTPKAARKLTKLGSVPLRIAGAGVATTTTLKR